MLKRLPGEAHRMIASKNYIKYIRISLSNVHEEWQVNCNIKIREFLMVMFKNENDFIDCTTIINRIAIKYSNLLLNYFIMFPVCFIFFLVILLCLFHPILKFTIFKLAMSN